MKMTHALLINKGGHVNLVIACDLVVFMTYVEMHDISVIKHTLNLHVNSMLYCLLNQLNHVLAPCSPAVLLNVHHAI